MEIEEQMTTVVPEKCAVMRIGAIVVNLQRIEMICRVDAGEGEPHGVLGLTLISFDTVASALKNTGNRGCIGTAKST